MENEGVFFTCSRTNGETGEKRWGLNNVENSSDMWKV